MKYIISLVTVLVSVNISFAQEKDGVSDQINIYYENLKDSLRINKFPNLEFIDQTGNTFDILSLKGRKVHINYWAFGCVSCFKEMPDLSQLAEKHKDSIEFLSVIAPGKVNFNHKELKSSLDKVDFSYKHVSTTKNLSEYGFLMVFPSHIILDEKGKLVDLFIGVDLDRIKKAIADSE